MKTLLFLVCLSALPLRAQVNDLLHSALSGGANEQISASEDLRGYSRQAFDAESENLIGRLLALEEGAALENFILLAGFLNAENLLANIPDERRVEPAVKRSINLARVRAGNGERLENLLKNLDEIEVNDDFNYVVVPLLVYTRQRPVFDFLFRQVTSENRRCRPADAETGGRIDCAYRMVEAMASAIKDFPVQADEEGNLLVTNYPAALAEVRRWFAAHQHEYLLDNDTF
jgi:hypothetical protein